MLITELLEKYGMGERGGSHGERETKGGGALKQARQGEMLLDLAAGASSPAQAGGQHRESLQCWPPSKVSPAAWCHQYRAVTAGLAPRS